MFEFTEFKFRVCSDFGNDANKLSFAKGYKGSHPRFKCLIGAASFRGEIIKQASQRSGDGNAKDGGFVVCGQSENLGSEM